MKLNNFIFCCFFIASSFAQGGELDSPLIEIFTLVEEASQYSGDPINFTLTSVGTAWYVEYISTNERIYCISELVNGGIVTPIINAQYYQYTGFNYCPSDDHSFPEFGFGMYRLQVSTGNYLYLDYRDTRYASYTYCVGHCADIWIKYDIDTDELYLKNSGSISWPWGDPIPPGELIKIWELKGQGSPSTYDAPYYWDTCLVLIPSQTGNHPRLVWGPYPNENFVLDYYEIHKKKGDAAFQLLTTTIEEIYVDEDEVIPVTPETVVPVWYKVKAIGEMEDDSFVSDYTNPVSVNVEGGLSKNNYLQCKHSFSLIQNYPNPFNPATIIEYSTPDRSNVVIKVYDMLGREVKELVNKTKDEGTYQVNFNAESLCSGVYFYTITAGNGNNIRFRESKQMVLIK